MIAFCASLSIPWICNWIPIVGASLAVPLVIGLAIVVATVMGKYLYHRAQLYGTAWRDNSQKSRCGPKVFYDGHPKRRQGQRGKAALRNYWKDDD